MLAVFIYGLKTQAHIVSWVTVIILVVVFSLGFIIRAARPNSEYFTSIKERRESGIKGFRRAVVRNPTLRPLAAGRLTRCGDPQEAADSVGYVPRRR